MISVFYERETTSVEGTHRATAHLPSQTKALDDSLNGDVRRFYIFNDRYRSPIRNSAGILIHKAPSSWSILSLRPGRLTRFWCARGGHLPPPDYLSIDTQGAELKVLRAGAGTLERHALSVFAEVRFAPTCDGQAMSSALEAYLRGWGFRLASLEVFEAKAWGRDRIPFGCRRGPRYPGAVVHLEEISNQEALKAHAVVILGQTGGAPRISWKYPQTYTPAVGVAIARAQSRREHLAVHVGQLVIG